MDVWKHRVWLINKAFKELNRKATFGLPTPFSPWFSSKALTKIWRVDDFTGYNNDIVFSVADKVEEWVIGHEREDFRSTGRIPHWNKMICLDAVGTDVLLTGWGFTGFLIYALIYFVACPNIISQEGINQDKCMLMLCKAPHYEGVWGTGGISPCIVNICTGWRRMVSSTPRPLYLRKTGPHLHWVSWSVWTFLGRNIYFTYWESNPNFSMCQPVA